MGAAALQRGSPHLTEMHPEGKDKSMTTGFHRGAPAIAICICS
jgi:hypothetical protein